MADINASPSTPEIQVLFSGDLADDDLLWVVRCSPEELRRLILAPSAWVAALGALPDWGLSSPSPVPAPSLTRDFVLLAAPTLRADAEGWVTVQGISGTNQLSLLVPPEAAPGVLALAPGTSAEDPFAAFWSAVARDPSRPGGLKELRVDLVLDAARFYAHFEILDPNDGPEERAARTAAFMVAVALDPEGYAAMLNGLDRRTLVIDRGSVEPGEPIQIVAPPTLSPLYANVDAGGAGDGETGSPPPELICNMLDGHLIYEEGTGTAAGTIVKRWGVE